MNYMEREFNSEGICNILEACAKQGVREFRWGDLEVSFGHKPLEMSPWLQAEEKLLDIRPERDLNRGIVSNSEELARQQWEMMTPQDQEAWEDARLSEAMLNEPSVYEDIMIDACLHQQGEE